MFFSAAFVNRELKTPLYNIANARSTFLGARHCKDFWRNGCSNLLRAAVALEVAARANLGATWAPESWEVGMGQA